MPVALLIEDDPQIGQLLIQELAREDWQINWCRDGDAGLRVLRSHSAAMVLLDLMLPDIDGLALCWMMRRQSDVPILILSARDELTDRVLGLDAGADDYLVKPFSITEVLARMRALIRRSRRMSGSSGDWLFAGKIQLSASRHQVMVWGQPVELSIREFALLRYLMENLGIVLTRDMILDHVWGWGFGGSTAVVDVYVRYLRQKIPWNDTDAELATVRGMGYTLKLVD
ncbi:MAG: DNA-binding response regulator [Sulfobacillus benefaciens]|uniref:Stage 0 sporulation protein A homolog n=1 Tax=Sulfobacillus benefaciens TaxID=453960 RepID=A0A2T2WZC0_9FIRM|nr:MAG: DNA-binding response regulator [Sulfobacillus benefaciens]